MKINLKPVLSLSALCAVMLFFGCSEEPVDYTSGTSQSVISASGDIGAKELLRSQMAKAYRDNNGFMQKSGSQFTVDGNDYMKSTNNNGKEYYTYMVRHDEDSETTFFNLVIAKDNNLFKTVLVRYDMKPAFAAKFNTGQLGFDDYDGTITFDLVTADAGFPCGETPNDPIPISGGGGVGGNGSGGSGDDGDPWDPNGNGNPHSEALVALKYLEMSLRAQTDQNNSGGGGDDGDRWELVSRSPRHFGILDIPEVDDSTNPCGDEEVIPVLLPFQIILDLTFLQNDCLTTVFEQLGGSSTFQSYLNNFDGEFSVGHLKLAASSSISDHAFTDYPQDYVITITFNANILSEIPPLDVAGTFIHEMIHAEIYRKMMMAAQSGDLDPQNMTQQQQIDYVQNLKNNFPGIYDYYRARYHPNWTHEMMAQHYRDIIIDVLKEYDNSQTQDVYEAIAWAGLWGEGTVDPVTALPANPTVAWANLTQQERHQIWSTYNNFKNSNDPCQN